MDTGIESGRVIARPPARDVIDQPGPYRPHRVERIIALSRLFLAIFFLIAVAIDPGDVGSRFELLETLSLAYLLYAALIALLTASARTIPSAVPIGTHVGDLALFSVFMYYSQGSASPFFVYFVFATVCGVLRWHGRGALYTGAAALAAYIGVTIGATVMRQPFSEFEQARFLVRCTQLAVITALLAYLGDHHRRLQNEIASLAVWPRQLPTDREEALSDVLRRAADILSARRMLLAWQETEEPSLHVASFARGRVEMSRERPDVFGSIVAEPLQRSSFFCEDASAPSCFVVHRVSGGFATWRGTPLDTDLRRRFRVKSVLALRILTENLDGRLFALGLRQLSLDDLLVGDIVARLVASALEQQMLVAQLRDAAAGEERLRLARDLHDGVLQSLTAVALQTSRVRDVVGRDAGEAALRLGVLEETILTEQRALRSMVEELKPVRVDVERPADAAAALQEVAAAVARQWDVEVRAAGSADLPPLGHRVVHEICRMARESLVNAIRHGAAKRIDFEWGRSGESVRLVVAYRGRGFSTFTGRHDLRSLNSLQAGPRTLKERVRDLGGDLVIESGEDGARVEILVPIEPRRRDSDLRL